MNRKHSLVVYSFIALTVFSGALYAQDIMWRVKCRTKGCTYTSDWNGDRKVVQQWSDYHVRQNSGHLGGVEGKGKN